MDNHQWNRILANFALISAGISDCFKAILIENILPLLFDDEEEEGDSSEDEEVAERNPEPKGDYAESVVPRQNDLQFRQDFRVTRATFMILQDKLAAALNNPNQHPILGGRPTLDHGKMLLIALWIFATPESYRSVARRFGVSRSTAWQCVSRVSLALMELNATDKIISWPNAGRRDVIKAGFQKADNSGFPGTIGAIDGCHIAIPAPKEDSVYYVNRKGIFSILLQGICDHETKFIDCYIGEVGSVHDATMLRRSDFYGKLSNKELGLSNDEHILGDKAYPLQINLLTPYKDTGHLTQRHRDFNTRLSRSRVTIERSFGLLKGRFRRLRYLDMKKLELIPVLIFACCILHNVCVDQKDIAHII